MELSALLVLPEQLDGDAFEALVRVGGLRAEPLLQARELLHVLFARALGLLARALQQLLEARDRLVLLLEPLLQTRHRRLRYAHRLLALVVGRLRRCTRIQTQTHCEFTSLAVPCRAVTHYGFEYS